MEWRWYCSGFNIVRSIRMPSGYRTDISICNSLTLYGYRKTAVRKSSSLPVWMNYTDYWKTSNQVYPEMFRDTLVFIRRLTLRKGINFFLIRASRVLSLLLRRPIVWGMPFFISIEPASLCNLECPQCPTGTGDIKRDRDFQ